MTLKTEKCGLRKRFFSTMSSISIKIVSKFYIRYDTNSLKGDPEYKLPHAFIKLKFRNSKKHLPSAVMHIFYTIANEKLKNELYYGSRALMHYTLTGRFNPGNYR